MEAGAHAAVQRLPRPAVIVVGRVGDTKPGPHRRADVSKQDVPERGREHRTAMQRGQDHRHPQRLCGEPLRCATGMTVEPFALLGPPALFVILLVLGGGSVHLSSSFRETGPLFAFSILVSTVSFGVYVALLRKQLWERVEINGRFADKLGQ